jgi:uncharacterized protein YraI
MWRLGKTFLIIVVFVGVILLGLFSPNTFNAFAQQPTGSVPTVTGTPEGPFVRVDPSIITQIRIYAGPSSLGEYPAVGILLANETAPALARAKGKSDWIQIYYPGVPGSSGWVFANYVQLLPPGADLKIIEVPATPTPLATPTINPTLVAAFIGQQTPTRLPTFTPPPPVDLPQFTDTNPNSQTTGVPTGLIILSLALFGFFGVVISYLRGR